MTSQNEKRVQSGFKLTQEVRDLLRVLANQNGISQAAVIELAVRQYAAAKREERSK